MTYSMPLKIKCASSTTFQQNIVIPVPNVHSECSEVTVTRGCHMSVKEFCWSGVAISHRAVQFVFAVPMSFSVLFFPRIFHRQTFL
jgi:hypothetical protein